MIYLVKSGTFSDVQIHGYFNEPEDAYAYCAIHNKGRNVGLYYVEAVHALRVDFAERPVLIYIYERYFCSGCDPFGNAKKWEMSYAPDEPDNVVLADSGSKLNTVSWRKIQHFAAFDEYKVCVNLSTPDPDKASKIALDTFYQVIAKKEELSL